MKRIELTALCTREEYLRFCASPKMRERHVWLTVVGALLVLLGCLSAAIALTDQTTVALLLLFGASAVLFDPLLLPVFRKGEAARLYDESDALSQAITVVFEGDTLTLRSAHVSGVLPLSLVTKTVKTDEMLALFFGAELTLLIPLRAFVGEDAAVVSDALQKR